MENMQELVREMDEKLRIITREYCQLRVQRGYARSHASRIYPMLSRHGPVETLKRLVAIDTDSDPTIGLGFLKAINRLDLSAEAVALDPHFAPLVTEELMNRARRNIE